MIWQEQVDDAGCGIACLAMLLDQPYARIVGQAPDLCGVKCGVERDWLFQFLAEHGHAVQLRERVKWYEGTVHKPWPVKPWAERHLCCVYQTKADIYDHYVCMDKDGTVYDPADPQFIASRLSRYYKVCWVAAVIRVGRGI